MDGFHTVASIEILRLSSVGRLKVDERSLSSRFGLIRERKACFDRNSIDQ